MTWIAARTSRIAIASDVLGLPFRLPALVAKMAESLDRLSGGRLVLGLGAGGSDEELAGFGAPVRSPGQQVDALEEALEIVRGVWREPAFTFDGTHHRTEGARLEPKPARPIPIWLGAYRPRMLELTGRLADGWIPSMGYLPPDAAPAAMDRVRAAAERAGRDPDALGGPPAVDAGRQIAGEVDEVVDRLSALLDVGFTVLNVMAGGRRDEQLERLGREVLPAVRRRAGHRSG
jgi:alkanesulfonate monooxygenase SsuD/methylene tetrahydromethanopterin reductase-like flavin-dependent oxidoreductase (luciferase family)